MQARLSKVMELNVPSDKLTEIYGYFLSSPYPRRWPRGEGLPNKNFKGVQFSVTNRDWAVRVSWHENDRQDDQTKSLRDRATAAPPHFATFDERGVFLLHKSTK